MSNRKNRIAISVTDELDDLLFKLSELSGQPKSKIILDIMEDAQPYLEQVVNALEMAKNAKNSHNPMTALANLASLADEQMQIINNEMASLKDLKMIDWVTMKISCDHDGIISNGEVVSLSKDGDSIEWSLVKFLPVVGSHDATISIRSITQSTIEISGNPVKWLQGHNLFGTSDLQRLVWLFFNKLLDIPELHLKPTLEQLHAVKMGKLTVSRIDINETWFLKDRNEVLAWLRAAGQKMRLKHRGAGQFKGDTLYWGKGSRRWFLKCYSKGDEINSKKAITLLL